MPLSLRGLPPPRVLRMAAIRLKYSGPRSAVFLPPILPSSEAGVRAMPEAAPWSSEAARCALLRHTLRFASEGGAEQLGNVLDIGVSTDYFVV